MSEETTSTEVEQAQSNGLPQEAQQSIQNAIWGELDTPTQTSAAEPVKETKETPVATTTTETQDEILETEEWVKKEFNVDNTLQ